MSLAGLETQVVLFIERVIQDSGPAGLVALFALMAVESFGVPPLPSEVILPVAGFVIAQGVDPWFTWPTVVVCALTGSLLGAVVAYEVGRRFGLPFVRKVGRPFGLEEKDLGRAEEFFARRGPLTVLLARLVPLVRAYISYPAGAAKMDRRHFPLFTLAGAAPFTIALLYVGYLLGLQSLGALQAIFNVLNVVVLVALVILAVAFIVHLRRRRSRRTSPETPSEAPSPPDGPKA